MDDHGLEGETEAQEPKCLWFLEVSAGLHFMDKSPQCLLRPP